MNEIYWITRLDTICDFLTMMSTFGFVISCITLFIAFLNKNDINVYKKGSEYWSHCVKQYQTLMSLFKKCAITTLVLIVINIFIPTKNDALLIYGVGGTIDYIKSNDTAKQLPDKCVKALDKWVDSLNEDNKQKENDNESK